MQLHHLFPKQTTADEYAVCHTAYLITVFIWQELLEKTSNGSWVNIEGTH